MSAQPRIAREIAWGLRHAGFERVGRFRQGFELARGEHDSNYTPMTDDVHAPQRADAVQQAAEIVLGVAGRDPG